jgi:sulfite reductase (ferredoxin)
MLPFCYFIGSAKVTIEDTAYEAWKSNVVQKQAGHLAIGIKVLLGDFIRIKRELADD